MRLPASRLPLSVKSLANLLRSSEISSRALASISINSASATLHSQFCEIHEEIAYLAADAADKRFAAGSSLGWLDGIPFAIKDNFCTEFGNTTARWRYFQTIMLQI
jgi:aspartyl-tRNA(Asn)/glutamyl-tRNA(Gln) amidotransferase subunit A